MATTDREAAETARRALASVLLRGAALAQAARACCGEFVQAGYAPPPALVDALTGWRSPRIEAAAALLAACRALVPAWDRVCRCYDEFGPGSEAYGEASDYLDTAVVAVVTAVEEWEGGETKRDADYVAAAVNAVPALLRAARALGALLASAEPSQAQWDEAQAAWDALEAAP